MLGDCVELVAVLLIGYVRGTCEVVFRIVVVEVEFVGWSKSIVVGLMEGVGDVGDGDGGLSCGGLLSVLSGDDSAGFSVYECLVGDVSCGEM
nr:hypothetical protein [Tanacetum cinerariifolium]